MAPKISEELVDIINTAENKRERVLKAIDNIVEFKKKQKDLYRKFYVARDDLADYIDGFKSDDNVFTLIKHFGNYNTDAIFYYPSNKRKRASTSDDPIVVE